MVVIDTVPWEAQRTEETRQVEAAFKAAGWLGVDAYRYNSASIRLRVIDNRFEGVDRFHRIPMLDACLDKLPLETQSDLVVLFVFAPSDLQETWQTYRFCQSNKEFESPDLVD